MNSYRPTFIQACSYAAAVCGLVGPAWSATQAPVRPLPLRSLRGVYQDSAARNTPRKASAERSSASSIEASFGTSGKIAAPDAPVPLESVPAAPGQAEGGHFGSLRAGLQGASGAALEGEGGELSSQRAGFDASIGWGRESGGSFALHAHTESSFYDFGVDDSFLNGRGDPFNDLYTTGFGALGEWSQTEDVDLIAGAEFTFGGEDEVHLRDSLQIGALIGARVRASEEISFTAGIAGQTRLEDDPWLVPYLGFDWQATDRLRLSAEGSEAGLRYALSSRWSAGLDANYNWRNYRLNDEGPLNGGAFHDEEIVVGAHLAFHPRPDLELRLGAARSLWRELAFRSAGGSDLGEIELEDSTWVGFSVQLSF